MTAGNGAATPRGTSAIPQQRRILGVLVFSQILGGAGLADGITVGALLAEEMLGTTGLAGLPSALFTAGSALGAFALGRLCRRWGRRPGLALGYAAGALGSLGVVMATVVGSAPLLFFGLFVYGAGTATNLMARYAGADLASPARRGRAVSTVLFATTLGAVAGPNLVTITGELAHSWGIPRLAGPFLLAAVAFAAASAVLAALLRPDPLRLAEKLARTQAPGKADVTTPGAARRPLGREQRRAIVRGTTVMVLTQLVMIALMTMTPVHMQAHGQDTQAIGLVIALHVAAMFLPSPLTGLLVDRFGPRWIAAASGPLLLAAGVLAALAPPHSVPALAIALVLLGLGWNFGLISGTTLVTAPLPPARRAPVQGLVDIGISIAGATGGMSSGLIVALDGFPALALVGGILALAVVPVAMGSARRPPRAGSTARAATRTTAERA
ncbi:MFS family permease [Streptomyces griseochromogenes]|uniref:MFS family permease n=1 Tax=Streptomyces griseochromogenes TaxID=68214 RepID=A0ABS4LK20_9ACTN|nr:MFS transporter [Streptomyces griseochromogenes]MBP2047726.1 MFS family permease [Streptomyces griseochromogenes]